MLSTAKVILPEFRMGMCLTGKIQSSLALAAGQPLMCGQAWVCPVCAAAHARRQAEALRPLAESFLKQGGEGYFITMTVRHDSSMILSDLLTSFLAARRLMHQNNSYKSHMTKATRLGSIRSLEFTHGQDGWHVHTHDFGFLQHPLRVGARGPRLGMGIKSFEEGHLRYWRNATRQVGLKTKPTSLHLKVVTAKDIFSGWDVVEEVTQGYIKAARAPNQSPMQLLYAATQGDEAAAALYRDYALATQGRGKLVWSDGLKERLEAVTAEAGISESFDTPEIAS